MQQLLRPGRCKVLQEVKVRAAKSKDADVLGGGFQTYGTTFRLPTVRTTAFGGLYWGPLNLGNYQVCCERAAL